MNRAAVRRDPGAIETLLRLRRWTRPHRRTIAFMIVTACGAMLAQALVPLVAGRIVDGPIAEHDTAGIWPLAGVALIFGIAEAVLFFARRYAMASAALGLESDARQELFAHLQRLPVAFHDRWPSGQLLSRATTDLSTIRRFVGFGFVFLIANSITAVFVVILLVHLQPILGLFVLLGMAPLLVLTRKFELRYSRDARRAQDLTGDLATSVEESALGIRVIKSYGRRPQMLASFPGTQASAGRGTDQGPHAGGVLGAAGRSSATLARGRCRWRSLAPPRTARSARDNSSPF